MSKTETGETMNSQVKVTDAVEVEQADPLPWLIHSLRSRQTDTAKAQSGESSPQPPTDSAKVD